MKNSTVLVTGGSGFVGVHCILQLLEKGYKVKTTLRSFNRKEEVIAMLKEGGISNFDNLSFHETNLTKDDNWDEAVKDCDFVLHVASPISLALPQHDDEVIKPAVEGTIRVLKAAKRAGVKRVVMTSNFGAVGYSHKDKHTQITEESWTDPNEKNLTAYLKSKVFAERAAWDFIKNEGGDLELAVINPVGIFGPSLGKDLSSGFELLKKVLEGSMKAIPKIPFGVVDVRDVADLHLRAMTNPNAKGERFLAIAGGVMTLPQIAKFLKEQLGERASKVSTQTIPDWVMRLAALFNPVAKQVTSQLGKNKNANNEKAKRVLGWNPRPNEEAILAAAESLYKFGTL
jgi:nucleoside-diphosphate-sugar epimerase